MRVAHHQFNGNEIKHDFAVVNHGSIMLVTPVSEEAVDWINEHVPEGQYFGNALCVEPRYIHSLVIGMEDAGLVRG